MGSLRLLSLSLLMENLMIESDPAKKHDEGVQENRERDLFIRALLKSLGLEVVGHDRPAASVDSVYILSDRFRVIDRRQLRGADLEADIRKQLSGHLQHAG